MVNGRRQISLYFGVTIATTLGHAAFPTLPFEVGAMVDGLRLDVSQAGMLTSAELIPYALSQFVLAPLARRVRPRSVAMTGALLILLGSVLSAFTTDVIVFAIARVLTGTGFALVFGVANLVGARAATPERAYAIGLGVSTLSYTLLLVVLSRSSLLYETWPHLLLPHSGVFIVIGLFTLTLMPMLGWIPDTPTGSGAPKAAPVADAASTPASIASLLMMALFSISAFGIYVFIERRGHDLAMSAKAIGTMFSSIYFGSGILGTGLAAALGRRWGTQLPLTIGLILQGMACLGIAMAQSGNSMSAAVAVDFTVWFFLYPYLFGVGAAIDRVGRLPIAMGAVYVVGAGMAATIAGFLVKFGSYAAVGWLALVQCILAAALAVPVARAADRSAQDVGATTFSPRSPSR